MSQGFGRETPAAHAQTTHRAQVCHVVVIDSGGTMLARLFLADRTQAAEMDAGVEEIASMTSGVTPVHGAGGAEWDRALAGHTAGERAAAEVYTLEI